MVKRQAVRNTVPLVSCFVSLSAACALIDEILISFVIMTAISLSLFIASIVSKGKKERFSQILLAFLAFFNTFNAVIAAFGAISRATGVYDLFDTDLFSLIFYGAESAVLFLIMLTFLIPSVIKLLIVAFRSFSKRLSALNTVIAAVNALPCMVGIIRGFPYGLIGIIPVLTGVVLYVYMKQQTENEETDENNDKE